MRVLGIDLGEKRVGVAISDELYLTAQGLTVLSRKELGRDLSPLKNICREYEVSEIVLGYPLNMNASRGEAAREAEMFKKYLEEQTGIPVHLWDERLTTASAEKTMLEADLSRNKRKKVRDKLSAVFILQSYLSSLS